MNSATREMGERKKINKRDLQAFYVVYNKLMFHIDFPLNWNQKKRNKPTGKNREKKQNELQIDWTENKLFHWCSFFPEHKKRKRTSIEWICNKSQFLHANKHSNTHKPNFKMNFFPHEQWSPCAFVLLMDKSLGWCWVLHIVSGFGKINKILPSNYGRTFEHNSLHWSSYSICLCSFISPHCEYAGSLWMVNFNSFMNPAAWKRPPHCKIAHLLS